MIKNTTNGNSKNNDPFQNEKIEFPVTFELKAVLDASSADDENMKNISTVFKKSQV